MENNPKIHWDDVYRNKNTDNVSWTQTVSHISLDFIRSFGLLKSSSIDVDGGDSNLVDFLLGDGYENITVLDVSEKAI